MTEYAYSTNSENYSGPFSRDEAIAEAAVEAHGSAFGTDDEAGFELGEVVPAGPASRFIPMRGYGLLESMDEYAADNEAPECAGSHFYEASREAREALDRKLAACIDQWATEYNMHPRWFTVDAVKEIDFAVGDTEEQTIANAFAAAGEVAP